MLPPFGSPLKAEPLPLCVGGALHAFRPSCAKKLLIFPSPRPRTHALRERRIGRRSQFRDEPQDVGEQIAARAT
jgi:hypothetical protein